VDAKRCKFRFRDIVQLYGSRFEDCVFRVPKFRNSLTFRTCSLVRCVFIGGMKGCQFGRRDTGDTGEVVGCDFRETGLHYAEFFSCDYDSNRFPGWPTVAIDRLDKNIAALEAMPWPPPMAKWIAEHRFGAELGLGSSHGLLFIDVSRIIGGSRVALRKARAQCERSECIRIAES
jgi:hypothetical protein